MKKLGEWRMNAPNEFINVTVLARAVAEQLKSSFDPNAPLKRVFTLEEAAVYCGMPMTSFKAKVVRDRIPKVRLDRCSRFDKADLDRWIDRHRDEIQAEDAA